MSKNLHPLLDLSDAAAKTVRHLSIRSLLLFTVVFANCVLFLREMYVRFGAVAAAVSLLAGLSIFAHIAGAAIGSRFRKQKPGSPILDLVGDEKRNESQLAHPREASATDFAPATELSRQLPLNRRPIFWAVGIGASVSAIVASAILTIVMWEQLAVVNVLFGAFSAAVIGGLLGFWLSSFYQVIRSAVADAQKNA